MISSKEQNLLSLKLKEKAIEEGFSLVGIAKIPGSKRLEMRTAALERWLSAGYQADMHWMSAPRRQNANTLLIGAKSILAVGLNYYSNIKESKNTLSIARYGWGNDYHKVIEKRLKKIGNWLKKERPNSNFKACVDSAPLLDKAWAEEAGLGWIGKHSNLITNKHGSWIFIGHLLSTEPLTPDKPSKSLCGKCQACIDACPTQAIKEPFVVDSNLCIAYHTIENRNNVLPKNIKNSMGTWIAGCDICQDVCPWNQKELPSTKDPEMIPREWILNINEDKIMRWNDEEWKKNLKNSALKRIKPWMWRRNATTSAQSSNPPRLLKN